MNRKLLLLGAIAIATPLTPAAAWFHAGSWSGDRSSWSAHGWRGGSASGGDGSWSATGYRFVKRQSQSNGNVWVSLGDPQAAPITATSP